METHRRCFRLSVLLLLLLLSTCVVRQSHGLAAPNKPIQRIAIVGSGISGLSVAHALTNSYKHSTTDAFDCVDIFDARPGLDTTAGAGIQLNGGLVALGRIHPRLREAVWEAGLPQTGVQSRCTPWFGKDGDSSGGGGANNKKQYDELLRLDLPKIIGRLDVADVLMDDDKQRLWWVSIMRGALQQTLVDELPKSVQVQFGKKVTQLIPKADGCSYTCAFADGTTSENDYDLIVGAEGINSVAKQYVQNPRNRRGAAATTTSDGTTTSDKSAIYSGIRIRYAVADGIPGDPIEETATLRQHFGKGAYALSGVYGAGAGKPNTQCAFIVYLDADYIGPFKRKRKQEKRSSSSVVIGENADWSQDNRQTVETARQTMLDQLQQSDIPTTTDIGQIIAKADRFFELGSYFHNPFGKWSAEGVVLCGDSAHALPPFLGQGSNQAIQDAYCLVEKIVAYNAAVANNTAAASDSIQLQDYLDEYEKTRWPSTFSVFWKAAFLGYLETGGVDGFYSKFRDVFFKTMGIVGVAEKVLVGAATPKM